MTIHLWTPVDMHTPGHDGEALQADTIEESWRVIHELVTTGKAKHRDGTPLKPASGEIVRLMERMAHLRPPKRRKMTLPEAFTPQATNQGVTHAAQDGPDA